MQDVIFDKVDELEREQDVMKALWYAQFVMTSALGSSIREYYPYRFVTRRVAAQLKAMPLPEEPTTDENDWWCFIRFYAELNLVGNVLRSDAPCTGPSSPSCIASRDRAMRQLFVQFHNAMCNHPTREALNRFHVDDQDSAYVRRRCACPMMR